MIGHIETLRRKLELGQLCLGSAITFTDPSVTETLCHSVDFFWIDLEHTSQGTEAMLHHLIAARAGGVPAIVRVPSGDVSWIKKVLDSGAEAIILPRGDSADDVRRFVSACRYPPMGTRGFGPRRPTDYGRLDGGEYIEWANRNVFVIAQIETAGAMNDLDEILAIEGLDSLVLGPFDLSGAIDTLGNVRGPVVSEAIRTVAAKASAAGKFLGAGLGADPDFARQLAAWGVQWIHVGCDFEYLRQAANDLFDEIRA